MSSRRLRIAPGCIATFAYTLYDAQGRVHDTSSMGNPTALVVGVGALLPPLEAGLLGMRAGEMKRIPIKGDDAYGPRTDDLVFEVPRAQCPADVEVGMPLSMRCAGEEEVRVCFVTRVTSDMVWLDANAPLSGQTLTAEVLIEGVRFATPAELRLKRAVLPEVREPFRFKLDLS